MCAIEVRDLCREYISYGRNGQMAKNVIALEGISFCVKPGELFGLLGPNGAGKTTTIKILTTLLLPTSGFASVLGHDVTSGYHAIRQEIGHASGTERGLYWPLSGRDNLLFFASLYGFDRRTALRRIDELLEMVGLSARADERVGAYSKGMKQRLHLARALMSKPKVIFLDEPTLGLDPVVARDMRQTLKSLQSEGHTILLTTHYMNEADALCDRVAIISSGKLLALGSPAELKARYVQGTNEVYVQIAGHISGLPGIDSLADMGIVLLDSVQSVGSFRLVFDTSRHGPDSMREILKALAEQQIIGMEVAHPTLEDAYVNLVSK
ncbi:MAG: ABC transporter ATP-binding protein [Bacillota bacterium]|nr:ABC transporter ATP-binding protein [Bacillota bacterium]